MVQRTNRVNPWLMAKKPRAPALDAAHQELFDRINAVFAEVGPDAQAETDPALVDTAALCSKHRVVHLNGLRFALEEDLDVQIEVGDPNEDDD